MLSAVAGALDRAEVRGADVALVDVTHDSREATSGWLFIAVPGARADGHDHAADAVARGASALLVERWLDLPVPQVRVASTRAAAGPAAAVVHGRPSEHLAVVGVTGTNGKTTTCHLLEGAFAAAGWGTGLIGTVTTRIHGEDAPAGRTTPEGPDLQRLLHTMWVRGADAVAMEVSSHGLDLHRVDGTRFAVAVFTNLSPDHLDWHGTMADYLAAKARLFTPELSEQGVVHLDGAWARRLLERVRIPVVTVGRDPDADARVDHEQLDLSGSRARVRWRGRDLQVSTGLVGGHNLANAVTAVVAAVVAGVEPDDALAGVAAAPGPPGRLERVDVGRDIDVLVDYAHTPDAVGAVVRELRRLLGGRRLVIVLGAGGDRDRTKRAPMGAAAAHADVAVLTTDNPRSEDPEAILASVVAGAREACEDGAPATLVVEPDRRRAIAYALEHARPGDVVVIAGKGHETTQELRDGTVEFDDRVVARELASPPGERP